jgi:hypothetical protein
MFVIIDNALTEEERLSILTAFANGPGKYDGTNSGKNKWIDVEDFDKQDFPLNAIIDVAKYKFDLTNMVGVECWSHYGVGVGYHVDKDEKVWTDTGEVKTPMCSIVYYAQVENLVGGRFLSIEKNIMAKTNRLIMFSPGLIHGVEQFTGTRNIVAINPWSYKIDLT